MNLALNSFNTAAHTAKSPGTLTDDALTFSKQTFT
jgi:hypothetical protein